MLQQSGVAASQQSVATFKIKFQACEQFFIFYNYNWIKGNTIDTLTQDKEGTQWKQSQLVWF